jgi:ATP-dependent Lhr-like helicase
MINWQQLSLQSRGRGINALTAIIEKLQGYPIPLSKWRELLSSRVEGFNLSELETLFLAGQVVWHRPRTDINSESRVTGLKRNSLIMMYTRDCAKKLSVNHSFAVQPLLSSTAAHVYESLSTSGSIFFDELQENCGLLSSQLETALSELVNAGMVTSDSFQSLLKLVNGHRQKRKMARRIGRVKPFAGRWTAIKFADQQQAATAYSDEYLKTVCSILLKRYGVIFYSILQRESSLPPWRLLRYMLKRQEARGEIVGGRFVSGVGGEQFADKEAIALLRKSTADKPLGIHALDAVDPVNVSQILALGEPIPVTSKGKFIFKQGLFSSVNTDRLHIQKF